MPIFFLAPGSVRGDQVTVAGLLARHLVGALRHRIGDRLTVVDDTGQRYRIDVTQATSTLLQGRITARLGVPPGPRCRITLAQAVLKHPGMDVVIQKATELGVHRIIPLITRRTIVRPRDNRSAHHLERWRTIAREAAQQCERAAIPTIDEPTSFSAFLTEPTAPDQPRLIMWEHETSRGLHAFLDHRPVPLHAGVVVGPEGGFDPEEVRSAVEAGLETISLGSLILRAETAGPVGLAILQYAWGDLGRPPIEARP